MFLQDQEWTKETVDFIQANSQLTLTQIYKWGWDQKKKVLKNPQGIQVPTIDEFGGYSKFDEQDDAIKITKVLDIDWNEKIRLLDLDWEREEKLKISASEPKVHIPVSKAEKSQENCDQNAADSQKPALNAKSFSTPLKKPKRDRYSSDITNVTVSGKNLSPTKKSEAKLQNMYVAPFFEEDIEKDYSFENFKFDNYDSFEPQSFILQPNKVSFPHFHSFSYCYTILFGWLNVHNLGARAWSAR